MYPDLDSTSKIVGGNPLSYRKTLSPSEAMTSSVMEIRQISTLSISSFKPHLNTHQCHLTMIINGSISVPLKIIFLRNYPNERPLIFVAKYVSHPMVNQITCEVEYQNKMQWKPQTKLLDLLKGIQNEFARTVPNDKSQIDQAIKNIDEYVKNVESLRTRPNLQPPPPPKINLQNILRSFEYEQNLLKTCNEKNVNYLKAATQYSENVSRVKCIGQRFSQGKILRQLQKEIDGELAHQQHGSVFDQLTKYLQSRKKYHRLKILKERYLEI